MSISGSTSATTATTVQGGQLEPKNLSSSVLTDGQVLMSVRDAEPGDVLAPFSERLDGLLDAVQSRLRL